MAAPGDGDPGSSSKDPEPFSADDVDEEVATSMQGAAVLPQGLPELPEGPTDLDLAAAPEAEPRSPGLKLAPRVEASSDEGQADRAVQARAEAQRAARLCARVAAGEGTAFAELVDMYQHRIYAFCARMLGGDRSEAEDLAQDVFLSVYRNASEFRGDATFTTWIYRIARNQTLNRIKYLERRGRSTRRSIEEVGEDRLVHDARGPHELAEGRQTSALVQSAIAELPEQQRVVLVLRDIDGLAYEDITDITGLALGTVKSRLHRARAALAGRLTRILP